MTRSPLHNLHHRSGAAFVQLFGWEVAATFGDVAAEYQAARQGAALLDRSYVGRIRITGKDALDLLNRLSSNKVDILPPGMGAGTVLPTSKGRVIDLIHLFATEDHLMMLTSPQTCQQVADWIDTYTFSEEIALDDVTEDTAMVTLLGPDAPALLERLTGMTVAQLEPYASTHVLIDSVPAILLRTDPAGAPGYDLVTSADQGEALWRALSDLPTGVTPIGEAAYSALRVEGGVPRYGWELSEEVNPWEVNLRQFISFTKGCYTGQEVILRLYNYKKIQRQLVALAFSSAGVEEGATLRQGDKEAGKITSVVRHPVTGRTIGLAIVRSAFAAPGSELEVVGAQGDGVATATVMDTPARVAVPA
ncbi:MAG: aminomethyl transferase family protein [Dehalococcoidia bacterium]|nr:aminomethyl transferase family protein [Dehalococcoidia bacterium]